MNSAMSGCRCLTILMQSAQLAQWARTARTECTGKTQPPAEKDKDAMTWASSWSTGTPRISHRHLHTLASWRSAKSPVCSGATARSQKFGTGGITHQEEEPCRLWVAHPRDPLEQSVLTRGPSSQETLGRKLFDRWALPGPSLPVRSKATPCRLSKPPLQASPTWLRQ